MVIKKANKEALTAAEIKAIKAHLLELREDAMARLKDKKSSCRLEPCTGKATICGTFIETDDKTGLAKSIALIKFNL